jgi:protein dithiol oxidoreductase (disulfide-forming)
VFSNFSSARTIVLTLIAAFGIASNTAAQQPQQAQRGDGEIVPIYPAQPVDNDGKIEVLEFFAYGCVVCYQVQADLEAWLKRLPSDVKFRRVPAGRGFEFRGIDSPPLFYALEAMGALDRNGLHGKMLKAANAENVPLGTPSGLNAWLTKEGIDPAAVENMKKSFAVQSKVDRAQRMTLTYKVSGTPMFIINGRVGVFRRTTHERLFAQIDEQIRLAREASKAAAATAK